jgi:hypothetical protein
VRGDERVGDAAGGELQHWSAAVQAAEERFGHLDVRVNNAGVVRVAPVVDESDEGWHTTMAVNATGVFYGMRAAIPALRRNGGGAIINIASIYGPVGAPGYVAYTAGKSAVMAMTKVAALEHARHRIPCQRHLSGTRQDPDERSGRRRLGRHHAVAPPCRTRRDLLGRRLRGLRRRRLQVCSSRRVAVGERGPHGPCDAHAHRPAARAQTPSGAPSERGSAAASRWSANTWIACAWPITSV